MSDLCLGGVFKHACVCACVREFVKKRDKREQRARPFG